MRRDIRKTCEPKARYRVRNWAAYLDPQFVGLINPGNGTIWIDEVVLARMADAIPTRGGVHPHLYRADTLIQALLGVKTVYRRVLRELQDFAKVYAIWPFRACWFRITPRSVAGQNA
ncbi:MAG: hypothetical protein E5299_00518 [Burkholderia gladioli]|nr:MAG: hypothetical protein E5299_00518 [Burkholderia gladioli]